MYDPVLVEQSIKLLHEGFSEEEIVSLLRMRRQLEQVPVDDLPIEYKRLKFARWCFEHDVIHESA